MLGGKRQLLGASCPDCREITTKLEGYVGRHLFSIFRAAANVYTSRPKERPTEAPLKYRDVDGQLKEVMLPISQHPAPILFPYFPAPDFFSAITPEKDDWGEFTYGIHQRDLRTNLLPIGNVRVRIEGEYDWTRFARQVAKIAHCHAVDRFGVDGFEHYLPPIIKGEHSRAWEYVGALADIRKPRNKVEEEHSLGHVFVRLNGETYIVVYLRLFGRTVGTDTEAPGTAIYVSVAGKMLPTAKGFARISVTNESFSAIKEEVLRLIR